MDSNFSLIAGRTDHHTSTHIAQKKNFLGEAERLWGLSDTPAERGVITRKSGSLRLRPLTCHNRISSL